MERRLLKEGYNLEDIRFAISCFGDSDYARLKNMLEHNNKKKTESATSTKSLLNKTRDQNILPTPTLQRQTTLERAIAISLVEDNSSSLLNKTRDQNILPTPTLQRQTTLERAIAMSLGEDDSSPKISPLLRKSSSFSESIRSKFLKDSDDASRKIAEINQTMKSLNMNFIDDSFRPNSSLLMFGTESESKKRNIGRWLRPNEIRAFRVTSTSEFRQDSSMPWMVFRGTIDPDDITQGKLGNCWFLSALACLAQRPDLVERLVLTKQYNTNGAYLVRLVKNGLWRNVIVDDYFPTTTNGVLAFTNAKRKQLYVPLIEKAFAKLHGSFGALEGGTCAEGLESLTGCPVVTLKIKSEETDHDNGHFARLNNSRMLWVRLLSSFEAGYLIASACHSSNIREAQAKGLQTSHAYSVLDVKAFKGDIRLVKLRNPHGTNSSTYKGDFGVNSKKWTNEMRNHFSEYRSGGGSDSGVFWMTLQDFFKYFHTVHICEVPRKGAHDKTFESRHSCKLVPLDANTDGDKFPVFQLEFTQRATRVSLVLHQPRQFRHGGAAAIIGMLVVKLSGSDLSTIKWLGGSEFAPGGSVLLQCDFDVGQYVVIPIAVNSSVRGNISWVLAVHSSKKMRIMNLKAPRGLVSRAFVLLSRHQGKLISKHGDVSLHRYSSSCGAIVVATNESRFASSRVSLKGNVRNARMIKSEERRNVVISGDSFETNDLIRPRKCQVLAVMTPVSHNTPWSWNIQIGMENSLALFRSFGSSSGVTSELYDDFPIGALVME